MTSATLAAAGEMLLHQLENNPDNGAAYDAIGIFALNNHSVSEAIDLFSKAIRLDGPVPRYCAHLGEAFARLGDYRRASACIGQALVGEPASSDFRWAYANLLHLQGENDQAAANYEILVAHSPRHAEAWFNLGVTRSLQKRKQEARRAYEEAVNVTPTYAEAWNNLALLEVEAADLDAAEACYRRALHIKADYRDALYNFAVLLEQAERLPEAIAIYERLILVDSGFSEAHNNLGNCYLKMNRLAEAQNQYVETLAIHASHREAPMNLGLVSLLMGDYARGWAGYEHRLTQHDALPCPSKIPRWDGKLRKGASILIHAEQGLGDTIQFARYLRLLTDAGMTVDIACPPALELLFAQLPDIRRCNASLAALAADPLQPVDWQLPFPSLPYLFRTRLQTIPSPDAYLKADPQSLATWRQVFSKLPPARRRVGLVWQGNPKHRNDHNRSLPFHLLEDLLSTPGHQFLSLQKSVTPASLPKSIVDLAPLLNDFSQTAAAIENLDLVISVDTAVTHLAGALGKPVWTLLPYAPDWRWLLHREDSPWYASMRLFRQPVPGDWRSVLREVQRSLLDPL